MKAAIITDIHQGARGASKYWISLMEEFYANTFFPTLKERGIDTVWLLGDTFDNRTSLNILALEAARRSFFDVAEANNIKIYAILGNHDVVYRDSNHANSMAVIAKAYPNVHLIYETETIVFDGCPINFVSWVNKNNMKSCMDFIDTCPPTILCGHFEISSFQMTPGQYNEHGFSPDLFKRFDKVFSGHFHTISNDGRIYYISNPFELNQSDSSEQKGFRIFDTSTQELELIENPVRVYKYIVYDKDCKILDFDYEQYRNKIVRVIIDSYSTVNQQHLNLFMEKIHSVAYQADVSETNAMQLDLESDDIQFESNQQLIDKYIDEVIDSPDINRDVLKEMFRELYSEALTLVEAE